MVVKIYLWHYVSMTYDLSMVLWTEVGLTEIKNKFCQDLAELKIEQFFINSNYQLSIKIMDTEGNRWEKYKRNVVKVSTVVLWKSVQNKRGLLAAVLCMGLNSTFMLSFSTSTLSITDGDRSARALISDAQHDLTFPRVHWCEHISSCSGGQFDAH